MGFFDTLKDKATDLAQASVAQSKRLAEIAKLKTANMGEEDTIKKAYIELGKLYFEQFSDTAEPPFAAPCDRIRAARVRIAANDLRIAELKEEDTAAAEPAAEAAAASESAPQALPDHPQD